MSRTPVGEEAVVANPHEPRRQHVQEEPADELCGRESHHLLISPLGVIFPMEPDVAVLLGDQPPVADRDTVGVPSQVLQYLVRPAEWRFGVYDPLLFALAASWSWNSHGSAKAASFPWKASFP